MPASNGRHLKPSEAKPDSPVRPAPRTSWTPPPHWDDPPDELFDADPAPAPRPPVLHERNRSVASTGLDAPSTSLAAAESEDESGRTLKLRDRIRARLYVVPSTDGELEQYFNEKHQTVSARRRDLVIDEQVEVLRDENGAEMTRPAQPGSNRRARIWTLTPEGRALVEQARQQATRTA